MIKYILTENGKTTGFNKQGKPISFRSLEDMYEERDRKPSKENSDS